MSVLAYPPSNDDEILRYCTKKCGYIASTEDRQFFALGCLFCSEKFLYFDAYIGHVQREHSVIGHNGDVGYNDSSNAIYDGNNQMCYGGGNENMVNTTNGYGGGGGLSENDELNDTDAALLVPQMIMVKEELPDESLEIFPTHPSYPSSLNKQDDIYVKKEEQRDQTVCMDTGEPNFYSNESYENNDYSGDGCLDEDDDDDQNASDNNDEDNYDDLVEESLLHEAGSGLAQHIKDRKMILFVIDSYRRNPYLWDHTSPNFRDRKRRHQFLDWMLTEFKRRFNVSLARDAITKKWDNLRTVYKRECNRMSLERTNISSLWYYKELQFLNRLYGANNDIEINTKQQQQQQQETLYKRRYSAIWNDISTSCLLSMMRNYPCFYDKNHPDYRSKDKRGEALQFIAIELQKLIDVSTIQISKRVSQLRFDYSKQKQERLQCELNNKQFVPNYSYYEQMWFMDADIAPFKCDFCGLIMQTSRDQETHIAMNHTSNSNGFVCPECEAVFPDVEQYQRHKQQQHPLPVPQPLPTQPSLKEPKYFCDMCTASFREKVNYDEHVRRHNDELLLPSLANANFDTSTESLITPNETDSSISIAKSPAGIKSERPFICELCGKSFTSSAYLAAHGKTHVGSGGSGERTFRCDFHNCGRSYVLRQSYLEHMRSHYTQESATCNVCGKTFKSAKNLQNHKQIHDAIKRYVCKICGSAFAQAAGLYLHKRRHTRNLDGNVDRHRGRQSF